LLIACLFLWLVIQAVPKHFASKQELMQPSYQVDINTAEIIDLLNLPEIGPNLAKGIIDHRRTHGPFRQLSDLTRVSGVGPRTLQRLSPYLTFPDSSQIDAHAAESHLTASGRIKSSSH
jgi:competence ComEA-like helix-hairpin-helix protein